MKKYFLNILFFFSVLAVWGQEYPANPLIREDGNTFIDRRLPKELRLILIKCLNKDFSSEEKIICLLERGEKFEGEREYERAIICYKASVQIGHFDEISNHFITSFQFLGYAFQALDEFDSSNYYFNNALISAEEQKDTHEMAMIHNNIATNYSIDGSYSKSLISFKSAADLCEKQGDKELYGTILHNIGVVYRNIHFYEESQKVLFKAIDIFEEIDDRLKMAGSYNALANIYIQTQQYEQALKYHKVALSLRKEVEYLYGVAGSLNNLGNTFQEMGELDSALYYYNESLLIKKNLGKSRYLSSTLDNIGDVYLLKSQFEQARSYYAEAYDYRVENNDKIGILVSSIGLARVLVKTKRFDEAETSLIRAEKSAEELNALKELRIIYELYTEIYDERKMHTRAFTYSELLRELNDTLLNADKQRAVMELEARFDVTQKQKEIDYLKQIEVEKDQQLTLQIAFNTALIVGMVILLGLLVLIYRLFVNKTQLSKKNETLLRDMHHRVKNNLQVLSSLFSLQLGKLEEGEAKEALVDSENRVRAMNLLHQQLYAKPKTVTISLDEYVTEMIEEIKISYHKWSSQSELDYQVESIEIDADAGVSLGLILTELLSNCFKHVVPNTLNAKMNLKLGREDSHNIRLEVSDNGPGYNWEESSKKSFGLRLVGLQVKQLSGSIMQESPNHLVIIIPMK